MSLLQQFDEAAAKVKSLTKRPNDDELLELYALYKQATVGDNNTDKPSLIHLKEKAKWDSWNDKKGVSKEDAQKSYIDYVKTLQSKYS